MGDVAGDGVAVQQRRIAAASYVVETRAVEPDVRVPELQSQRPRRRIDSGDTAALAVGDAEAKIVALDDHGVADGDRAARQLELYLAELARFAEVRSRSLVQVGNVGAALGNHHGVLAGRRERSVRGLGGRGLGLRRWPLAGVDRWAVATACLGARPGLSPPRRAS
ncbi:hypothetical protein [Candidatus Solirubrobacter pratensis]|uniref:hypothetical protein n=1 Tax=Candidatus Solirubrobacter pratensis TaxID=1298857 RepID=UPI0004843609|nr:hypothetical protein [Candidatus Solirubrobacter pratensis]